MLREDLEQVDLDFVGSLVPDDEMADQLIVITSTLGDDGRPMFRLWVGSDGNLITIVGLLEMAKARAFFDCGMMKQWIESMGDD